MANPKIKGSNFERSVAKSLSTRFATRFGITDSFRRASDSGAYFGASNSRRLTSHDISSASFGDIVTPPGFWFTIEAKAYRASFTMSAMVKQNCGQLDRWIEQAEHDARSAGRVMALVVKFNHVPPLVFVNAGWNIIPLFRYHAYEALRLDDWLNLDDSYFFRPPASDEDRVIVEATNLTVR